MMAAVVAIENEATYSLWDLIRYFLRLGAAGFGGPVALVGYMHRDLVEGRGWILESDYREGLALAQLAPGPLAAQLAIYMGYVHYRILGATLVGLAFVLPSFVIVGWAYVAYGGLPWMQAVFYGVGACVIGIIVHSAYKLTRKSIGTDKLLLAIFALSLLVTFLTESEEVLLFLLAGVIVWLVKAPPKSWPKLPRKTIASFTSLPLLAQATNTDPSSLVNMAVFFLKAGTFVFGSGLAIIPFLYSGVVNDFGWLTQRQFLDAVAVAMITPGPVVITVGFIGYLVAGFGGASIAAIAVFLPCYLFTIIPAPYFKKYGKRADIAAFVEGITAAAIGALSGAVVVIARRSLTDIPTLLIAIITGAILWKTKKISEPVLILIAAGIGLVLYPLVVRT